MDCLLVRVNNRLSRTSAISNTADVLILSNVPVMSGIHVYIGPYNRQPSTLSSWSHWPRGPVDLKSYWPPGKSTGPHFSPTDVYIRD